ncbi:site-2 protease family protein [Adhaeribacter rhizoryzae]|uniref:Site-2 protease family protein n=1 Tax=Adhaeribacter rhizoryzae TaxID=2607907 RepID=A0A5M6DMH8_9BACT|nr:site-2 protease family protein [Adhaeribacter rhizoryzae]KAA5548744.1 site-2 protease family protein [Adhaeribacter rhizoryzae]
MLYKKAKGYALHIFLFLLTLFTTTIAGAEWLYGRPIYGYAPDSELVQWMDWQHAKGGLLFSLPFLFVLTCHEFGHYFTARYYKIRVTLPYYIPMWLGFTSTIGTMGAFIRIKDRIFSKKEFFDVGIAGPLAGFVVALPLLYYGFTHLPEPEYIFQIHPAYEQYGLNYPQYVYKNTLGTITLGDNLLFLFFENYVADARLLPNKYELIHYPLLFAGYLSLFFTALNLLPIGQLDGGHILYGLIGYRNFNRLSPVLFFVFILYAGLGILSPDTPMETAQWAYPTYAIYLFLVFQRTVPHIKYAFMLIAVTMAIQFGLAWLFPDLNGYPGWLLFGLILSRFLGIFHPPAPDERPLSTGRKVLGCVALLVFILCFSPTPLVIK